MNLGDRMKAYENEKRFYLTNKVPVVVRIDGKAFHTFTKRMDKPFDEIIDKSMEYAMFHLSKIQNVYCVYRQSDEISLLFLDTVNEDTEPYFRNNLQKIVSITASLTTYYFNQKFKELSVGTKFHDRVALFDSRAFNVPYEDVFNYFVWRKQDAYKNAVSSIAQSMYSHKQLHKKNTQEKIEMIGDKFENYTAEQLYGTMLISKTDKVISNFNYDSLRELVELSLRR